MKFRMRFRQLLNPVHIYQRRQRIKPYIKKCLLKELPYLRDWILEAENRGETRGRHELLIKILNEEFGPIPKAFIDTLPITENERRLAVLKNKHKGQRCFIIGNGPSLRITDLDRLKGEITFASNKIYLTFDQTDWRPTYYVVEDSLVAQQNYDEINSLQGFPKFFPNCMKLWVPVFKDGIYYEVVWEDFYPKFPGFGINALDKLYWGATVTYTCMQFACFMGIKEIYLIGVDFDFSLPKRIGEENQRRIYFSEGERNHFHPDYHKPGEKWHEPKLHHQEKAFLAAREAVQQRGGQIFNATRGGRLKIFPRVDFDTLFTDNHG